MILYESLHCIKLCYSLLKGRKICLFPHNEPQVKQWRLEIHTPLHLAFHIYWKKIFQDPIDNTETEMVKIAPGPMVTQSVGDWEVEGSWFKSQLQTKI